MSAPVKESDLWHTPELYLDAVWDVLGLPDLDPASSPEANERVKAKAIYTAEDDGLVQVWDARTVYCNPPYSNKVEWVPRWCRALEEGECSEGILLVPASVETQWFRPLWRFWLCFVDHRIRFERPDGTLGTQPRNPSVFAYGGPRGELFAERFGELGHVVCPSYTRRAG